MSLTAVSISPATVTIDATGSQVFTATKTGTATDVVYAWSLTGDTDNVSLSSSSGNPVTVTTTNDTNDQLADTVTVNVSATSSSAGVSSGITDTSTITLRFWQAPAVLASRAALVGTTYESGNAEIIPFSTPLFATQEHIAHEDTVFGPYIPTTSAPLQRWTK